MQKKPAFTNYTLVIFISSKGRGNESESANETWKNQKMKNEIKIWHAKLIARNPSPSNILVLYVAIYR